MTGNEEKKRPVAHKMAVELLRKNPAAHLVTLAALYGGGTVVPLKDIPWLIEEFERARAQVDCGASGAIKALEEQAEEAKKKEAEKTEG